MRQSRASNSTSGPAAAALLLLLLSATAAAQVPPDERYLMFKTEHFRVVFPDGMESFARRAAERAEWAYAALSDGFMKPPPGRIALVITNYSDRPNASATPIPDNRVVLISTPDLASQTLNWYNDWVDNTLVHELVHIFHLDRNEGAWKVAQTVFGRVPFLFPAFYQPKWVIEGLATYYESRLTGSGRAYGSAFEALLNNDANGGVFRTVDAGDGLSPIWPSGQAPYAYGGLYFRDMAESYGDSAVSELITRGAYRLPYTFNWASGRYFGETVTGSWQDWSAVFESDSKARADSLRAVGITVGEPISDLAWRLSPPRFSPDGSQIAYTYISPRDDPATVVVDVGSGSIVLSRRRNGSGVNAWMMDGSELLQSQSEYRDRYHIYGDVYSLEVASGRERRWTKGARLSSPDMSPNGSTLVAVQTGDGTNRLVTVGLHDNQVHVLVDFDYGVNWENPRWSPNGEYVAAERWVDERIANIAVIDRNGRLVWQVTQGDASDVTPAWSPDGRYLLWASDRDGVHDLYAVQVSPAMTKRESSEQRLWRLTRTLGGARGPDVSPNERWLAFISLYPEGSRVELIRYDTTTWERAGPGWRTVRQPPTTNTANLVDVDAPVGSYSPFPSLWPKAWFPIAFSSSSSNVGWFIGASTFGADDIRRHEYAILAGWRTGAEAVEGTIIYRYSGFGNPVLDFRVSQEWSGGTVLTTDGDPVDVTIRERDIFVSANLLRPRMQTAFSLTPYIGLEENQFTPTSSEITFTDPTVSDLRVGLVTWFTRARAYPRSVSAEKGFVALLDLSHRRRTEDRGRWRVSAEGIVRGYLSFPVFGYANHILAGRVSLGTSYGHNRSAEAFGLGGVPGRDIPILSGISIGGGSRYPLRGYSEGVEVGDRIVSGSLEYRFPLWLVGRGYGLWPIMLDKVSASLFWDIGSSWRTSDDINVLSSVGTELSVDLGLAYAVVYRFRVGLAVPVGDSTQNPSVYLAAGVAF
jgi:Tol biopolymer transport system component